MKKQILEQTGTNLKSKLVAMVTAATMVFAMVPLGAGVAFADEENDEIQDAVVAEMPDPEAAEAEFVPEEAAPEAEVLPMQVEEPQVEADAPQQVQAQATLKDLGTMTVDLSGGVNKILFDTENISMEAGTILLFMQIEKLITGVPGPVEHHSYINLDGAGNDYDFELYPEEIDGTSASDAYFLCFKKLDTANIKDSYTVRMPQAMIDQYTQVEIPSEGQNVTGFYSAIKFVFSKPAAVVPQKAANTLTLKAKKTTTVKIRYKRLKKRTQAFYISKVLTVSRAQGNVTYTKVSGNKKITVSPTGKVTVKKKLKRGTYKIKVNVTAAGNTRYNAMTKTVVFKVKVKR